MVYLVTGERNCGKTRALWNLAMSFSRPGGFCADKIIGNDGLTMGYQLSAVDGSARWTLALDRQYAPDNWDTPESCGSFHFARKVFERAYSRYYFWLQQGHRPLIIDEVGPLELDGMGFGPILHDLLHSDVDMYWAVRNSCVEDVVRHFALAEWKVMHCRDLFEKKPQNRQG